MLCILIILRFILLKCTIGQIQTLYEIQDGYCTSRKVNGWQWRQQLSKHSWHKWNSIHWVHLKMQNTKTYKKKSNYFDVFWGKFLAKLPWELCRYDKAHVKCHPVLVSSTVKRYIKFNILNNTIYYFIVLYDRSMTWVSMG